MLFMLKRQADLCFRRGQSSYSLICNVVAKPNSRTLKTRENEQNKALAEPCIQKKGIQENGELIHLLFCNFFETITVYFPFL